MVDELSTSPWQLWVETTLPFLLHLPPREYRTAPGGELIEVLQVGMDGRFPPATVVRIGVPVDPSQADEEREGLHEQLAYRLMHRLNRLLRWYRASSGDAAVTELSRRQASPFRVRVRDDLGHE